ncbi:uncharacterized protein LOC132832679 isoform X2 [Hemiscyllium ocellatum]|uniref:uncharacterized protein LOC132832679 isoform X2 n=1 Tax=Hemiscyllium ocellatum TaxID=170820 RepID=UPI002966BF9A|nr:uncharacterized protein LOC132832679 isoform X2 [Hemiscyllium ocellatum]
MSLQGFECADASGSGVTLRVPQREVNGIVSLSVNLSVSYSTLPPYSTLKIQWRLFSENTPFVTLSRSNCSPGPVTSRYNCSDHQVTGPSYRHRVQLDPETGSLWLRDLQSNDSGVYVISVYRDGEGIAAEGNVTLTVYSETDNMITTPLVSSYKQPMTSRRHSDQGVILLLRVSTLGFVAVFGASLYWYVSRRCREKCQQEL